MRPLTILSLIALLLTGGIFGFFYAWICSTMWGLDAAPPEVAIAAMQAMNASVRNAVFAPAFFATGPVLLLTAMVAARADLRRAAWLFAAAGLIYLVGAFLPTMAVNVPMNEALAQTAIPADHEAAEAIWRGYSPRWQLWNIARSVASAVALVLCGAAMLAMAGRAAARPARPAG